MQLTREQQAMLEGAEGPTVARAMGWLVAWGDAMEARRLVSVENVMPGGAGVPVRSARGAELEAVEDYVREMLQFWGTPARAYNVTGDIARFDFDEPEFMEVPPGILEMQQEILRTTTGASMPFTWTCTPYLVGNVPARGQICAWTESHAVVYINSILGARTTRHGAESSVAAAITGYVPEFSVLLDEGRRGDFLVEVSAELRSVTDWGALGYFAGQLAGLRLPVFTGVRPPNVEATKQLCAALATGGGVSMFHMVGVTPEAPTLEAAFQGEPPAERYSFGPGEKEEVYAGLRRATGTEVDFVYVGCPHCTLSEVAEVVRLLDGRRVADGVLFLVTMPYGLKAYAARLGLIERLAASGVRAMTDTCPAVSEFPERRRMVTNSVKQAHYLRAIVKTETVLADVRSCVEAAVSGRWS